MTDSTFLTIVVPVDLVSEFRELAALWEGGVGMFTRPLATLESPEEVSHYISSGLITTEVAALLCNPAEFAAEVADRLGRPFSVEEAEALRDAAILSEVPVSDVLEEHELMFYSESSESSEPE